MSEDKIKVYYDDRFIMVNYDVIMSGKLTTYEIAIYVALCAFANHYDRSCYPSYTTLAEKAGCSRSTAIRTITSLLEKGLIEKRTQVNADGEYQSNVYVICTSGKHHEEGSPQLNDQISSISDTPDHALDPSASSAVLPYATASQEAVVSEGNKGSVRASPKLYSSNYINKQEDEEDDIIQTLKRKIEYDYFCQEMPDRMGFIDDLLMILFNIKRSGDPGALRLLDKVDSSIIIDFMDDFKHKPIGHVQNYSAWLQKVFLEYLRKCEAFRKDLWR